MNWKKNLKADELRGLDAARRKELAAEMRRRLGEIRMDIYTPSSQSLAERRAIKKNIARLATVGVEPVKASKKG